MNGPESTREAALLQINSELRSLIETLMPKVRELTAEAQRQFQRAEAAEQMCENLKAERDQQAGVMAAMNSELEALKRHVFGKRSEKMPPMAGEVKRSRVDDGSAAAEGEKKRKENREARKLLTKKRVDHKVNRTCLCPKCGRSGDEFKQVGKGQQTGVYEYIPARFEMQEHFQETLACPCGEHMVTAPGPIRVVDGGSYGPGFIANLLVSKGADSIPFYRMEKQFKRLGIDVARATMVGLFHKTIERCLTPISRHILNLIRTSQVVLADETTMGMLEKPDTGKAGKGYVWTFISGNLIAYRFSATRSGETPLRLLGGTLGTLVVDAYSAYNKVCSPESRTRAGCLAHVRRKFFDALATAPEAQHALDQILQLYIVEHEAAEKGITRTPAHLALRKSRSAPIMAQFRIWLDEQDGRYLPKGSMGKAISYAIDNWEALTQFLKSEQIPLDNNQSERALRVVALGRKNFLFVGNEDAGANLASLYTVLATCEANGVNPLHYLMDILPRVQDHPNSRLDELLPQNWRPPIPAADIP